MKSLANQFETLTSLLAINSTKKKTKTKENKQNQTWKTEIEKTWKQLYEKERRKTTNTIAAVETCVS